MNLAGVVYRLESNSRRQRDCVHCTSVLSVYLIQACHGRTLAEDSWPDYCKYFILFLKTGTNNIQFSTTFEARNMHRHVLSHFRDQTVSLRHKEMPESCLAFHRKFTCGYPRCLALEAKE